MTHRTAIWVLAAALLAVCGCGLIGRGPGDARESAEAGSATPPAETSTPGDASPSANPSRDRKGEGDSQAAHNPLRRDPEDEYDPAVDAGAAEAAERLRRRYYDKDSSLLDDLEALPELTDESRLEAYLAHAAIHNREMKEAWEHWRWAVGDHFWSWYPPHPYAHYELFVKEAQARPGKGRSLYGFSQKFLWLGKLKGRAGVRGETVNAAREAYEAERLKLFYRVKRSYHEYAALVRVTEILEAHKEQLAELAADLEAGSPGAEPVGEAIEEADEGLRICRERQPEVAARLNEALGRAPGAELPHPRWYPPEPVAASDEQLVAWCREANPELARLQAEALRAEHAVYKARQDYFPDLSVGVVAVNTQSAKLPGTVGHSRDHHFTMFSVQMPLWLKEHREGLREARLEHWDALEAKVNRQNEVETELRKALYRFRAAEGRLDPYATKLLPEARQDVRAAADALEKGEGTVADLVEARRVLLEVRLGYERAAADYAIRRAELEMLVGRNLPRRRDEAGGAN